MAQGDNETAIILGGGGARAAYQVGALRAIVRILGRSGRIPFPVLCGTSAGAINAAALAINADDFRRGVARLLRWWRRVSVAEIYRADLAALSRHSAQFLAGFLTGTRPPPGVAALLDNAPLANVLDRQFDLADEHTSERRLRALSINATSYTTGTRCRFFQGHPRDGTVRGVAGNRHSCRAITCSRPRRSRSSFRPAGSTTITSWTARCASSRRCRRRSILARGESWCWPSASSAGSVRHPAPVQPPIRRSHKRRGTRCRRFFSTISRRISSA
jgi:hypothetical protein